MPLVVVAVFVCRHLNAMGAETERSNSPRRLATPKLRLHPLQNPAMLRAWRDILPTQGVAAVTNDTLNQCTDPDVESRDRQREPE